jgi:SWI/SNF-related matrix-associated actin-dependent regulator of chromatin subfamily A3
MCRHPINLASLLELPPDISEWVEPDSETSNSVKSAKIAELIRYLKIFAPSDKTLVFSQFTSFLDHVAASLRAEGIQFCRFDGSMTGRKASKRTTDASPG